MSFEDLMKQQRGIENMLQSATGADKTTGKDERLWIPSKDKAGNGYAMIRFLPGLSHRKTPWAKYHEHAFKGPTGQWYIEKSLTDLKQQDAIAEMNSKLWNSGIEADKAIVRERKRNLRHVCNVLILHDPANPENEGQVKLFRFGTKIMGKIVDALNPRFPDEEAFDPCHFITGADFNLKIQKVAGYPNYDASSFIKPAPLFAGDIERLKELYDKQYDLDEFDSPDSYKSPEELKARLNVVLGLDETKANNPTPVDTSNSLDGDYIPSFDAPAPVSAPEPMAAPEPVAQYTPEPSAADEDIMAKFRSLADD